MQWGEGVQEFYHTLKQVLTIILRSKSKAPLSNSVKLSLAISAIVPKDSFSFRATMLHVISPWNNLVRIAKCLAKLLFSRVKGSTEEKMCTKSQPTSSPVVADLQLLTPPTVQLFCHMPGKVQSKEIHQRDVKMYNILYI